MGQDWPQVGQVWCSTILSSVVWLKIHRKKNL